MCGVSSICSKLCFGLDFSGVVMYHTLYVRDRFWIEWSDNHNSKRRVAVGPEKRIWLFRDPVKGRDAKFAFGVRNFRGGLASSWPLTSRPMYHYSVGPNGLILPGDVSWEERHTISLKGSCEHVWVWEASGNLSYTPLPSSCATVYSQLVFWLFTMKTVHFTSHNLERNSPKTCSKARPLFPIILCCMS